MKAWKVIKDFNREEIRGAIETSTNFTGALNILGMNPNGKNRKILKDYCKENSIPVDNLVQKQTRGEYEKNPKLCKHCGKQIPWEKRENEYCCKSCATIENNKRRLSKGPRKNKLSHEELLKRRRVRDRINRAKKSGKEDKDIVKIKNNVCPVCGQVDCINEFCEKHNLQQLRGFVKHLGFDETAIGTERVFSEFYRVKKVVYDLYWTDGLSMVDLGKKFNYSSKIGFMPKNVLDNLEIPRRSLSESQKNYLINNPAAKLTFSETIFRKNLKTEAHISWNGEEYFLRSSYEIEYAESLDALKILYMVENFRVEYYDSQQKVVRIAIPDFYLPESNEIVEIKSDFTLDIQEMRDRFGAYKKLGYSCKLVLEKEEVDLYNIENILDEDRLEKIKTKNIKVFSKH